MGAGAGFIKPTGYCSYTRVVRVLIVLYNIYLQKDSGEHNFHSKMVGFDISADSALCWHTKLLIS
jgi:hypothetical protein